jgi:hypothetical protein
VYIGAGKKLVVAGIKTEINAMVGIIIILSIGQYSGHDKGLCDDLLDCFEGLYR